MQPNIEKLKPDLQRTCPTTATAMRYCYYTEFNRMDTAEIKEKFENLHRYMNGMPL